MMLFEFSDSNYVPEVLSDSDYDYAFTKEAIKYQTLLDMKQTIDEKLIPQFNRWINKLSLDRYKLNTLFKHDKKVDN
jgi:hypothetical protein